MLKSVVALQRFIGAETRRARTMRSTLGKKSWKTSITPYKIVAHTKSTEQIFACKGIALCSRKFRMYFPKNFCSSNHLYNLSEERKKQVAANKRNGVVGSNGKNIPITPNNNEIHPNNTKKNFMLLLSYEFHLLVCIAY